MTDFDTKISENTEDVCSAAGKPKPQDPYKAKGGQQTIKGLPLYCVGTGKKIIIVIYDVFGWCKENRSFHLYIYQ